MGLTKTEMKTCYLACDLGAESGRLMLGTLDEGKLALEEIHRFPNVPLRAGSSIHWDVDALFGHVKEGLRKAAQLPVRVSSFSCDTWGVDYLLFDAAGNVMKPAFHYRDPRFEAGVQKVYEKTDWPAIFAETGVQFMGFNSIFQLAAEAPDRLESADRLLLVADGFNFLLSGVAKAEVSLASTSQLYNPQTRKWSRELIRTLGYPERLFPPIVASGTRLGFLKQEIVSETGLDAVEVIAGCSHDTAAAVAAVPASGSHWAYISSGTWSLMGVEFPVPIINESCRELNFTNEIGYGGSVRLLKNIIGLWLIQECRRDWSKAGREFAYSELADLAAAAEPFASIIDPADPRFIAPDQMPERIAAFCSETGQPVPKDEGAVIRCVLESLALLYRRTLREVERITGSRMRALHIVGGGSKNTLLNQFTANAAQITVVAGPSEATAAGNVLVQAIALGHLPSLQAARDIVRSSMETIRYEPQDASGWNKAFKRFDALTGKGT